MRVFVTGANGFVGKTLIGLLQEAGHEPRALLLPDEAVLESMPDDVVRGDLTDKESLVPILNGCDAIVHLAGAVGYGQSWEFCQRVNVDGTRNLAEVAVAHGIRRFVHLSSVSVYGRVANTRLDENAALKKIDEPYGDTKIDAEILLRELEARGDLDISMIRPTVIYGPGDIRFLPKLLENLRSPGVRVIGTGTNTVDLVHVEDVARFAVRLLDQEKSIGKVYNVNNSDNPTWNELMELASTLIGIAPPTRKLPYPVAYVVASLMELASRFTGKEPRMTRYAVRVVGRQYHYITDAAVADGFTQSRSMVEGITECLTS